MSALLPQFGSLPLAVIGMLHLKALPGSPGFVGEVDRVREAMLADAAALVEGGVHALMLENFGDAPFYPRRVPAHVVAHLTALAAELRRTFALPLGINVLRNDGESALAVAHAAGASFIRVNVLCGARVTDQGIIHGIAHRLLRQRNQLGAAGVRIMADVDVKHSAALAPRPLESEVHDLVMRGRADAVIVSGAATGKAIDLDELTAVRQAAGNTPVWVGSGVSLENIEALRGRADGVIVGSALKHGGEVFAPVDLQRVREFMHAANATTERPPSK